MDQKAHVTRAGTTLCLSRESRASWCTASSRPTGLAGPEPSDVFSCRSLPAAWKRCWPGRARLAMQYSPNNCHHAVSMVDAGHVEFCAGWRSRSSARPIWVSHLRPGSERRASRQPTLRLAAGQRCHSGRGWKQIGIACGPAPASGARTPNSRHAMAQRRMRREGLIWDDGPNVRRQTANCSDSHYEPTAQRSAPIKEGDFFTHRHLGRGPTKPGTIFYDITWTGSGGARSRLSANN